MTEKLWRKARFAKRRKGRQRQMRRLLRHSWLGNNEYASLADLVAHRPCWIDEKHGRIPLSEADSVYVSGVRRYAKDTTNRKIRAMFRNLKTMEEPEDVEGMSNAEYQKYVDYDYILW